MDIGHTFMEKSIKELRIRVKGFLLLEEKNRFREMLEGHGKAFVFSPNKIRCMDPKIMEPMVIFMIDHVPWNLKRILVPRAYILKIINLLKEKVAM